ncbi:FERM domain-containing protein 6-like [Aulostomus maculatus]
MRMKRKRHVCVLLSNKQHLDCTMGAGASGREVLNSVLEQLGISELGVLGLAVLRDNEYLFLDLEQQLSKYFGRRWRRGSLMVPFILFLRVQYYVESGQLILSSRVRQLYYTELRQKVLRSQSRHQEALFFQLAASALQAESGDLDRSDEEEREQRHHFLPEDYFPSWLLKRRGREFLLQHGPSLHGELRGASRNRAVLQFIGEASRLQDAPVTFYRMRQEKKEVRCSILLGVTLRGVQIYQEVEGKQYLLCDLSWTDVDRFTFQGSRFEIHAVGSLCLPKLLYYTPSSFHSKHILKHLSDSHRFQIRTREALSSIQELEGMWASRGYEEAYVCDTARLRQKLHCNSLSSSVTEFSVAVETTSDWTKDDDEKEGEGFEQSVDEPAEVFVDGPAELSWLVQSLQHAGRPSGLPLSCWAAVTMEMTQVLRNRADGEVSVD